MNDDEANRRVDYETSGDEYWATEEWPALSAAFNIHSGQLPVWHDAFAGQGRAWEILRRLYRVAPLVGELAADDLRAWTRDDLAEKLGVSRSLIDEEISGAVKHWKTRDAHKRTDEAASLISEDEMARLTRFSDGEGMSEGTIEQLLSSLNFTQVRDKALRAEVALRIISLKSYLTAANTRVMAREVIRMEISMHGAEQRLLHYQGLLEATMAEAHDPQFKKEAQQKKIEEYNSLIDDADQKLRKLSKDHSTLLKELGADEIDMTARKRVYVETVSYLVEKCAEYESNPENALADGVFTHGEIDWLLEPEGKRGPQYRPDISIRVAEALIPENLWNRDYVPTPIQRRVSQELLRMVKHMRAMPEAPEEDDTAPKSMDDDDESEDDADTADAIAVLSAEPDDTASSPAAQPYRFAPRQPATTPAMGVF